MMFANGCGKSLVGVQGMVNIKWTGIPKACAQCKCAKLGGFAIIASATKGSLVLGSGSIHDLQHPSSISKIILRLRVISPPRKDARLGMIPGLLTMYLWLSLDFVALIVQEILTAINSSGSPPIAKKSRPASLTKLSNTSCVARRIL